MVRNSCALYFFFLLILTGIISIPVQAQESSMVQDSIYSETLQEMRKIEVIYPKGYNPAAADKYEVLYCLEGIPGFAKVEYNFLTGEGFIPNMVLVGLPNSVRNGVNMRDRDFTPTHTYGETGGADRFLTFLKKELLPYIQAHYAVKSKGHTLYGGSLSGLFAVYTFLKEPALFTSYIAIDPSLWWDNFYLIKEARQFIANPAELHNTLWLAGREGSAYQYMGIAQMDSVLSSKRLAGFTWRRQLYANETHYSTQFKGLWDGLKFSYGGFYAATGGYPASRQLMIKPQGGIVVKGKPFKLICYNLADSPYVHFTTDGTEPAVTSRSLAGEQTELTLDKTTLVKLKSISMREEYNKEDSVLFETGSVLQPIRPPGDIKPGGLHYVYYEGNWDTMPDLSHLQPMREGKASNEFDLSNFPVQSGYVLSMDGYIKIERPGYYIFTLGGKNFKAFLDGQLILGNRITGIEQSYMVPLAKGFYPLRIQYLHIKGDNNPTPLYLKPEDITDFAIPPAMLYSH